MALKAARGAQVPLGLAEDFARAVACIALKSPEDLTDAVAALETDEPQSAALVVDALRCGTPDVTWTGSALIRGYLEQAGLEDGRGYTWTGSSVQIEATGPCAALGPVAVPPDVWSQLEAWAHRTYVPATEASRQGAGAGAIDND